MEKSVVATTSEKVSNHIPDDLAFSILSKLPQKSLKRFGCVCKSWALLFENRHFMNIFRNNFISYDHPYYGDTSLLLQIVSGIENLDFDHPTLYSLSGERFENKVKLDWPPPFQEDDIYRDILILGSVNGILCLSTITFENKRVVLWNPNTKEFKVIPPSFAKSISSYIHGFGYDHVRDDYKVIKHVSFPKQSYYAEVELWEIYSLRSNSWKKFDSNIPIPHIENYSCLGVHMDGMCHWWVEGTNMPHDDGGCLVSFDLGNEVFFITPGLSNMDDSFDLKWLQTHLVVSNGSIALISLSYYEDSTTCHISILGEIGVKESWTKLFIVESLPCFIRTIGVGKKGNIFFKKEDGEVVWFDLSTQMIGELDVNNAFLCQIVIYKESLIPIGGIIN